jgi:translation initiation factor 3 subunit C
LSHYEQGEPETEDERAERLRVEKEANMTEEELRNIPVVGSLSLFLNRLDDEYIKSLQRISSHSADYIIRLRDEAKLVKLLSGVYKYFLRIDSKGEAAEMALRRVEHLYYCHDTIAHQMNGGEKIDTAKLVSDLCTYVYQEGTDRAKTRAMLCHIYHHALHDRFLEARDLLLMSHLQENIANVGDVSTMILFNRMMVKLGLSAFRLGKIWDAHQCLSEICAGRNQRELLAQGISSGRYGERSPEEEKAEKRRQVPYHQHINLDLVEACHLICAMLLEVPNMAAASDDGVASSRRVKTISRLFRKHCDIYNRQVFTGPPEQIRDYIMSATKFLMKGEWKECADLLTGLEVWSLIPGDDSVEEIQKMLVEKIKLEGLRTYLYAFSAQYESLCLGQLCEMFDLTKNEVHSIVSKMMINREIHGSWDQPTDTIVLRQVEASALQVLSLQFAEKTANLVESNERLLDTKTGNFHFRDNDGKYGDNNRGYGNRRGGHGGRGGRGGHRGRGRGGRDGRGRGRGGRDGRGRGRGGRRQN